MTIGRAGPLADTPVTLARLQERRAEHAVQLSHARVPPDEGAKASRGTHRLPPPMLDRSDWKLLAGLPVLWPDLEDAWLHAILTIDTHWKARHRGHAWRLDSWGEGPSLLTFADLGLELEGR